MIFRLEERRAFPRLYKTGFRSLSEGEQLPQPLHPFQP